MISELLYLLAIMSQTGIVKMGHLKLRLLLLNTLGLPLWKKVTMVTIALYMWGELGGFLSLYFPSVSYSLFEILFHGTFFYISFQLF